MFGVGVGVRVGGFTASGGGGFDPDAQAFFDRVTTAGGSLTTTEKNATNQLVLDMKSAGIWTPMLAIYPMVGASAAACAQNLKSSSFTGTFSSGWTFASTGVKGNGTSAYFNTNINGLTSLNNLSNHFSYYSRTQELALDDRLYGITTATPQGWQIIPRFLLGDVRFDSPFSISRIIVANTITTGLFLDTRTSATSHKGFISNTLIGSESSDVSAVSFPSINVYVSARNNNGTAGQFSSKECAFFTAGDGLTDTQASNFYTAVQAFQTTLSRQV